MLLPLAALSGCTFGAHGREVYQAEGLMVSLDIRDYRNPSVLTGELLAVESDAFVVDASLGNTPTVVRVPLSRIARGRVYAQSYNDGLDAELAGYRKVGALDAYGRPRHRLDLNRLCRFPHGLEGAALDALLSARGQTEILPYTEAPMSPRR